jgi:hypothetical protein
MKYALGIVKLAARMENITVFVVLRREQNVLLYIFKIRKFKSIFLAILSFDTLNIDNLAIKAS